MVRRGRGAESKAVRFSHVSIHQRRYLLLLNVRLLNSILKKLFLPPKIWKLSFGSWFVQLWITQGKHRVEVGLVHLKLPKELGFTRQLGLHLLEAWKQHLRTEACDRTSGPPCVCLGTLLLLKTIRPPWSGLYFESGLCSSVLGYSWTITSSLHCWSITSSTSSSLVLIIMSLKLSTPQ